MNEKKNSVDTLLESYKDAIKFLRNIKTQPAYLQNTTSESL